MALTEHELMDLIGKVEMKTQREKRVALLKSALAELEQKREEVGWKADDTTIPVTESRHGPNGTVLTVVVGAKTKAELLAELDAQILDLSSTITRLKQRIGELA